ncbi:UBN2_2 domain-containing protein, partial [Cephalotus follicularis]
PNEKATYERWERSNRLSLMLIQSHVSKSIRGSILDCDKVVDYMKSVEEQFVRSDKALASTIMNKLSGIRFDNSKSVHEHIMEIMDIAAKLKSLEVEISKSFLVHFILNSLSIEYGAFKNSYNTHKEKWYVNELLTMCLQKEKRVKHEKIENAHIDTQAKRNARKGKSAPREKNIVSVPMKRDGNKVACFFCKKMRHVKKNLTLVLPFILPIPCRVLLI